MSLLEKAYAKMCGSYHAAEKGLTYMAINDLMGLPYLLHDIDEKNLNSVWRFI